MRCSDQSSYIYIYMDVIGNWSPLDFTLSLVTWCSNSADNGAHVDWQQVPWVGFPVVSAFRQSDHQVRPEPVLSCAVEGAWGVEVKPQHLPREQSAPLVDAINLNSFLYFGNWGHGLQLTG